MEKKWAKPGNQEGIFVVWGVVNKGQKKEEQSVRKERDDKGWTSQWLGRP